MPEDMKTQQNFKMNDDLRSDMLEAASLTRAGRLGEATAFIQRLLRAGAGAGKTEDTRGPQIIDLLPHEVERSAAPDGEAKPAAGPHLPKGLSGLLARLDPRRGGRGPGGLMDPAAPAAPHVTPEGGQFITRSFANHAGKRAYKLYIPSGYRGQKLPLIVMLHGCTQSPDDFAAGTRMNSAAEAQDCFVAYPEQPSSANGSKCWNWYKPADQRREQGEPSLVAGIARAIMGEYKVDPQRIYVAGLSAGAAAAVVMGATYPDLFAAVGVHSGLACGAANDLPSALAAMRQGAGASPPGSGRIIPTIVFHGDRDATVHPRNGDQVIEQVMATGNLQQSVKRGAVPGGHTYSQTLHIDEFGEVVHEQWVIHGAGHAWSGGSPTGSYIDPFGPDATGEMLRFFLEHRRQ